MNWNEFDAVLFDLDGVLTPTADIHQQAWHETFAEVLAHYPAARSYSDADYFDYVDGKPRYDGVASLLASRQIKLPWGTPQDAPNVHTVCGIGNRKNALFESLLAREGIRPYPGSLALVEHLHARNIPMAVVSSSKNASEVLKIAAIDQYFPVVVDGRVAEYDGVPGKPAPDMYELAARRVDVPVGRAVVVEDAVSGVQSGKAGAFGLVIGVDRGAGVEVLKANGADVVVSDLGELV